MKFRIKTLMICIIALWFCGQNLQNTAFAILIGDDTPNSISSDWKFEFPAWDQNEQLSQVVIEVLKLVDEQRYQPALQKLDQQLRLTPSNQALLELKAIILVKIGQLEQAEVLFHRVLSINPDNIEVYARLGSLYLQVRKLVESEKAVIKALERDDQHPLALIVLAQLHTDANNLTKAIELYKYAIASEQKRRPESWFAMVGLARLFNQIGQYGATHQLLQPVTELKEIKNKLHADAAFLFGEACLATKDTEGAKAAIKLLDNQQNPDLEKNLILKARVMFESGQNNEAIAMLKDSVKSPDIEQPLIQYTLFGFYSRMRQIDEAATVMEKAIDLEKNSQVRGLMLKNYANYLFNNERPKRVLKTTSKLIEQYPEDLHLGFLHASALKFARSNNPALKHVNTLIEKEPQFAAAYTLRGEIYKQMHKEKEAEASIRRALEIQPERVQDWITLAYLQHHGHGHKGLLEIINEGLEKNPGNIELRMEIAAVYNEDGHYDKANLIYEDILKQDINNVAVLIHIGQNIATQGGDQKKARAFVSKARDIAPQSAPVIAAYGWVLHLIGDDKNALTSLLQAKQESPYSGQLRYRLAETYSSLGKNSEAKQALKEGMKLGLNTSEKKKALALLKKLN